MAKEDYDYIDVIMASFVVFVALVDEALVAIMVSPVAVLVDVEVVVVEVGVVEVDEVFGENIVDIVAAVD